MSKPTRTASELSKLLQARFAALPGMGGTALATQLVRVVGIEGDGEGGPTWMMRSTVPPSAWRPDVARVLKQLQLQYDLDCDG
ncbi:hypothetical protein ABIC63_000533 [Pseudacidovorax sp. 1753]|uniref:hypothetical protein n=1 Tax=Pseudacidovorax sp. 1753 TaxID=3156419 RepID=UPI0033934B53